MKLKLAPILDPSVRRPSPKPVRVDLRKVFTFGTALWAIALVACMILLAIGINVERAQTMCAAGTVVGVLMLVWEHFDRWDYRRLGEWFRVRLTGISAEREKNRSVRLPECLASDPIAYFMVFRRSPSLRRPQPRAAGSVNVNVLPCPGALHTEADPWWVNATCLTMASPSPTPSPERSFWLPPR